MIITDIQRVVSSEEPLYYCITELCGDITISFFPMPSHARSKVVVSLKFSSLDEAVTMLSNLGLDDVVEALIVEVV
jgi:hypothetical protein